MHHPQLDHKYTVVCPSHKFKSISLFNDSHIFHEPQNVVPVIYKLTSLGDFAYLVVQMICAFIADMDLASDVVSLTGEELATKGP